MDGFHPLLGELLGIAKEYNLGEDKAYLAFETYMELCEVHKLWEVKHFYNDSLKIFYLTGKEKRNSEQCDLFVPIMSDETLSPELIEKLHINLSPDNKSLVLVFKDRDSSSTYYRVTSGLIRPDSPDTSQRKKNEEKERARFQKELQKNRKKIFMQALESQDNSDASE